MIDCTGSLPAASEKTQDKSLRKLCKPEDITQTRQYPLFDTPLFKEKHMG